MIYKSYIVEQNISKINQNLILFYGENLGLKIDLKNKIKFESKKKEILNYDQEEILSDISLFFNEINNNSLFNSEKIIFINNASDKIVSLLEGISLKDNSQKIYLFSNKLEKKSKLRNYFEKSENCASVPCYEDNEISIKKIILNQLKEFEGLSTYNMNIILENSNLDRIKLNNEIEKIQSFFSEKKITTEHLEKLLDPKINENFNNLRDEALLGNKKKTNNLLSNTTIETEKNAYYLSLINQRLSKIHEVINGDKNISLERRIENLKPPIFWKDKEKFTHQAKKWTKEKTKFMLKKMFDLEITIKSNTSINKSLLIKKVILELCEQANT